jgi:hypothetical protein
MAVTAVRQRQRAVSLIAQRGSEHAARTHVTRLSRTDVRHAVSRRKGLPSGASVTNRRGSIEGPAGVAQLVEQLIRNQQVAGSSPIAGSTFPSKLAVLIPIDAVSAAPTSGTT